MAHPRYADYWSKLVEGPYKGKEIIDVIDIDLDYVQEELIAKGFYTPQKEGREAIERAIKRNLDSLMLLTEPDDYFTENE